MRSSRGGPVAPVAVGRSVIGGTAVGVAAARPLDGNLRPAALKREVFAREHRLGRVAVQVLSAAIVEVVVVGPQQRADHRADRNGVV